MQYLFAWRRHAVVGDAPSLAPGAGGHGQAPLVLETVVNIRDLGGLVTADGRQVRAGKLFRSGNPGLASAADMARLRALQLDLVIDFRSSGEKSPAESGFGQVFRWVASPVLEGSMSMAELMPRLRGGSAPETEAFMLEVYRDFPRRYQAAFGGFLKTAEQGGNLLYHCTAGKDRTGFASLLLLGALGVGRDAIMANYLDSNRCNQGFNRQMSDRAAQSGVDPAVMWPLLEVKASYLEASMHAIEQDYGGMETYLGDVLGVDAERLRQAYLVRA
ncbi:tyrosine-protein phosphatase [Cupriavidus basilensis]|uniref:Tyrosine-protein phosphatase n=1 Tax=Cupriavidus basilensis TaxID=68895 RepID=A0ABT6AU54_9BURK|nr:tyrosine-protein phosphatase [Cupriavidus basilensis]MDF3836153.1 tyrosine-protein phosphatase [Cupriavidus basilensis]